MIKKIIDSFHSLMLVIDGNINFSHKRVFFVALLLLFAGTGLRCSYWMLRDRQPRDSKFYIEAVENINNHDPAWFKKYNFFPPLMPWIAAKTCLTGISPEKALIMLNMGYAVLWVLGMFYLCRDLFDDDRAGLLGMAFAAFNPYSVRMASQILREPLYILLFTLSLWCAVRVIRGKGGNLLYPAGIGMLTILGFYTRIEGFEIILFLPVALVILLVQYKKQYLKQCIYSLTVFALTVSVLFAALLYFKEDYMSRLNGRVVSYYKLFTSERVNDL